jgi:integrase
MIQRDQLVLIAPLLTGMSRSELIAVRWSDLDLDSQLPSLVIRRIKDGRRRRQPLPTQLAAKLRRWRELRDPGHEDRVFCSLRGRPLDAAAVERSITAAASRVLLDKRVKAATLRDTAAKWLRQAGAADWLLTEYFGRTDSLVSRYADIASNDMRTAMQSLADYAISNQQMTIARKRTHYTPYE